MKRIVIDTQIAHTAIDPNVYGHFSEHLGRGIYEGLYVGESSPIPNINGMRKDVIEALRSLQVPNIRWPGGCFAEYYNWKDGIGPKTKRQKIVNTAWGGVTENNHFGTHEFLDFCELIGCEPYMAVNVGSSTPRECSEWIEYMNSEKGSPMANWRCQNGREKPWNVRFFGVGNENWGCGGNMRAEYYADIYRQFATYVRDYGDKKPYKIACGADGNDYLWTETLMKSAGHMIDGLSLHYYTMPDYYPMDPYPWEKKGSAVRFDEESYYRTLKRALFMDELITNHRRIMDQYDPQGKVAIAVDEWGTWHQAQDGTNPAFLFQQNTMRDAIVAALTLNIFNRHSERVKMANLAQMINVLQSLILTDGKEMILTPTYHVFDLFRHHMGARRVECHVVPSLIGPAEAKVPLLSVSASVSDDAKLCITAVNTAPAESHKVKLQLAGRSYSQAKLRWIHGEMNDHNEFGQEAKIKIQTEESFPISGPSFTLQLPACSVTEVLLQ